MWALVGWVKGEMVEKGRGSLFEQWEWAKAELVLMEVWWQLRTDEISPQWSLPLWEREDEGHGRWWICGWMSSHHRCQSGFQ